MHEIRESFTSNLLVHNMFVEDFLLKGVKTFATIFRVCSIYYSMYVFINMVCMGPCFPLQGADLISGEERRDFDMGKMQAILTELQATCTSLKAAIALKMCACPLSLS